MHHCSARSFLPWFNFKVVLVLERIVHICVLFFRITAHSRVLSSVAPAGEACAEQIEVYSNNSRSITICLCSSCHQFGRRPKGFLLNAHRTRGPSHRRSLQRWFCKIVRARCILWWTQSCLISSPRVFNSILCTGWYMIYFNNQKIQNSLGAWVSFCWCEMGWFPAQTAHRICFINCVNKFGKVDIRDGLINVNGHIYVISLDLRTKLSRLFSWLAFGTGLNRRSFNF